jgi:trigger factor
MKVDYAKLSEVIGEVSITISENDYAEKVEKELKDFAKKAVVPGFRPGKAPKDMIRRKYGEAAKADAIQDVVSDALYNYIKDNDLKVLGNPIADASNTLNVDGAEHTLKFRVGLAPELTINVDKNLHIPYYKIEISEDMIKRQDEALRRHFGKQDQGEEVDETALVKGTITELNEDGTVKEGGVVVENGIVSPQYFRNEDQRKLFLGKKVADEVVFNPAATSDGNEAELSSMLNIDKDEVANHKGDFLFSIKEILVLKPAELGEEFYKSAFGDDKVKDEAEYNNALRAMIESSLTGDQNYRFTIDAKEVITNMVGAVELPDEILKDFLMRQNESLNKDNIDSEYDAIRDEIVWDLEKDIVAKNLKVEVKEDDLINTARIMARNQFAQYGMMNVPENALDQYAKEIVKDQKSREQVARQTADMMTFAAVREAVTLDEKPVTVEEFNKLFAPAEEAAE